MDSDSEVLEKINKDNKKELQNAISLLKETGNDEDLQDLLKKQELNASLLIGSVCDLILYYASLLDQFYEKASTPIEKDERELLVKSDKEVRVIIKVLTGLLDYIQYDILTLNTGGKISPVVDNSFDHVKYIKKYLDNGEVEQ